MAFVKTTFTPDAAMFPYRTLTESVIGRTNVPLGEVHFKELGSQIPAVTGGDIQEAVIEMKLPTNYAYVLAEIALSLNYEDNSGANIWDKSLFCFMKNSNAGGLTGGRTNFPFEMVNHNLQTVNGFGYTQQFYAPVQLPRSVYFVPTGNDGQVECHMYMSTADIDGTIVYVGLSARFLQFNINQAHDAAVNLPQLTR